MTDKELAKIDEQAPKFITEVADGVAPGMENMRNSDVVVPRFRLMQSLSPMVVERKALAGQILNSLTDELVVDFEASIPVIPIFHYIQWIQWGDREANEGMIDQSLDPDGSLAQMAARRETRVNTKGKEVQVVTEYHNFICICPDISVKIPIALSCAKTSFKTGKKLLGMARFRGNYPLFAGMYSLKPKLEKNKDGQQYYIFDVENAGWVKDKALFNICQEMYEFLKTAHEERRLHADQSEEVPVEETEM